MKVLSERVKGFIIGASAASLFFPVIVLADQHHNRAKPQRSPDVITLRVVPTQQGCPPGFLPDGRFSHADGTADCVGSWLELDAVHTKCPPGYISTGLYYSLPLHKFIDCTWKLDMTE